MDGGLDDPLVRMHRWDALRQRLANSASGRLGPVVDELVEAIATVLYRHAPVTVTLTVEGVEARTTVQLGWQDGQLMMARQEPPPPRVHDSGPAPGNGPPYGNGPPPNGPAHAGPPTDGPYAGNGAYGGNGPYAGRPAESSEEIAARLAELIRRDPSLLDARDDWGGPRAGGYGVSD